MTQALTTSYIPFIVIFVALLCEQPGRVCLLFDLLKLFPADQMTTMSTCAVVEINVGDLVYYHPQSCVCNTLPCEHAHVTCVKLLIEKSYGHIMSKNVVLAPVAPIVFNYATCMLQCR